MKIENGMIVFEKRDCHVCQKGFVSRPISCKKCGGSGNGPRGGKGGCKECHGNGTRYDWVNPLVCSKCNGNYENFEWEDAFTIGALKTSEIYEKIPVRVIRSNREQTFAEAYIGAGLWSVTDCGDWKKMTDEELIEKEFNRESSIQAIKLIRDKNDLRICDEIVILTSDNGYSLIPYFKED